MCQKQIEQLFSICFENIISFREPSFIKIKTNQKITFNLSMRY